MKNLSLLTGTFGILSTVVVATPGLTQTAAAPRLPRTQPNLTFNVQRQSGACPRTVSLWHSSRYYEGGGEHTAIANTAAIAGAARLVGSNKKYAEFRAPLQRAYASCVGQARSNEDYPYLFRFGSGNVTFRVELPPDTPSNPSTISDRTVMANRPMVRWAIAD
ncbi:hypothetical protein [Microseira sp. BLCC-F43]|uniref:hypothetical protein n=1 Tax=Microseira sp. BLCC-F43 TaxID=3153602 RepID=UPI0035B95991